MLRPLHAKVTGNPAVNSALRPCDDVWGQARLLGGEPPIRHFMGVSYIPHSEGPSRGLFGADGLALEGAIDFFGPEEDSHSIAKSYPLPASPQASFRMSPESTYIYGGQFHLHFGHFLINTLSRLWALEARGRGNYKVLMHGPGRVESWFDTAFARDIFQACGLSSQDIVTFEEPTFIPRVIVPSPAFQERTFIYRAFQELFARIGKTLLAETSIVTESRPIYLTKVALTKGVNHVTNETILVKELERRGVEIVHPEKLRLHQQIELFAGRKLVSGLIGSAWHVSLFWPARAQLLVFSPVAGINSNYCLFDMANNNKSEYYYSPDSTILGEDENFGMSFTLKDPIRAADDLFTLITKLTRT